MDTIAAQGPELEGVVAARGEGARDRAEEDLAAAVLRAPSVDAAFARAREVYPLGLDPPRDVREALFNRTAKDHLLMKVLLLGARQDRDMVQELLAWWWERGMDSFDPSLSSVRTYLNKVLFHRLMNEKRKETRRGRHHTPASDEVVAQACDRLYRVADLEAMVLLDELVEGLPPAEVLAWLLASSGYSNEEISRITGIPSGSVSRVVARVRLRMEGRYASRNPALLALFPAAMLQRASAIERVRALLSAARGALATAAGRVASYALVAGLGAGVAASVTPRREVRVVAPPVVAAVAHAAPAPAPAVAPPAPVVTPVAAPVAAPPVRARVPSTNDRAEEAAELEHALAALGERPSTAASLVAAHRRRWPRSPLANTRDALEAEALSRTGQVERARALAARVVARSPQSPEAFRMRQLGLLEPTP